MTIVRGATLVAEPWANGGGVTRVIADRPGVFRLSLATIAASGPFSHFPQVMRHFALVNGRIDLSGYAGTIDALAAPLTFSGEQAVLATLVDGPALALNLMVPDHAPPLRLIRSSGETRRDALAIFACERVVVDDAVTLDFHDTLLCNGPVRISGRALVVAR